MACFPSGRFDSTNFARNDRVQNPIGLHGMTGPTNELCVLLLKFNPFLVRVARSVCFGLRLDWLWQPITSHVVVGFEVSFTH